MAHAQAQINIEPYSGKDTENFPQFEQLFQGFIGVANITNNQRANFLQLHLRDAALWYFQNLSEATRLDVDLSLNALRDQFCNNQIREIHVLRLEQHKFDQITIPRKTSWSFFKRKHNVHTQHLTCQQLHQLTLQQPTELLNGYDLIEKLLTDRNASTLLKNFVMNR